MYDRVNASVTRGAKSVRGHGDRSCKNVADSIRSRDIPLQLSHAYYVQRCWPTFSIIL